MQAILAPLQRIADIFIGAWAVLAWLFTCDEEHELTEPPEDGAAIDSVGVLDMTDIH